ncbi:mechanosensitive ion channel family protein [Flavobacterium sp. JP2137]|uniref:mechanosensitive ion channel family protein n=1 Tax=Flavobacterium sp. JP2137 TaxID=3414510 RepID=UPI003D2FDC59
MNSFSRTFNIEDPSQFIATLINTLASGALKVLIILLYVLISWACIRLISFFVRRVVILTRIGKLQDFFNANEFLKKARVKLNLIVIIEAFVKIFFILIFIVVGADMFGLEVVSSQIGIFVSLIPQFFISLLIFISGLYLASWVRKAVTNFFDGIGFGASKLIGKLIFYIIFVFFTIIALNQAGINTDIITNNISIIVGAVFVTMALSLGLGSKDLVTVLLYSFYTRKNLEVGMRIRINQFEGMVLSIDNIYLCLLVDGKKTLIPIKTVSSSTIEYLESTSN